MAENRPFVRAVRKVPMHQIKPGLRHQDLEGFHLDLMVLHWDFTAVYHDSKTKKSNRQSFFNFQENLNEGKWIPSKSWRRSPGDVMDDVTCKCSIERCSLCPTMTNDHRCDRSPLLRTKEAAWLYLMTWTTYMNNKLHVICLLRPILGQSKFLWARSRIKFVMHFMYIDCTYILFKKIKTTHRKLMSCWPIRMTLLGNTISQSFKKFTWFWIFLLGIFVRPWQIWQKMATVSLPHKLYHYTPAMRGKYGLWKNWSFLVHVRRIYSELK
jgi:hypothetical protein